MLIAILIATLFAVTGGLLLWGAVRYRKAPAARDLLWTGGAALLLLVLFGYVHA